MNSSNERQQGSNQETPSDEKQAEATSPTNKKAEANRRNSKKSTGPRTARGKAQAKLNATKLGIYAFFRILPGELENEYEELMTRLHEEHKPVGAFEEMLVDKIGQEIWTYGRIEAAEGYGLAEETRKAAYHREYIQYVNEWKSKPYQERLTDEEINRHLRRLAPPNVHILTDASEAVSAAITDPESLQRIVTLDRLKERKLGRILRLFKELRLVQEARQTIDYEPPTRPFKLKRPVLQDPDC